jgi:hypothetical protein
VCRLRLPMRVPRNVKNSRPSLGQRVKQGPRIGFRATASEESVRAFFGKPELARECVDHPLFRFDGNRTMTPGGEMGIQGSRNRVTKND